MAEHFMFFDSTEQDIRDYQASQFAEYFSKFLSDGVYTENGLMGLRVTTTSGFNIKVSPGFAFMRGYLYNNDTDMSFTLDGSDSVLDRIDRIVLKLDIINRKIEMQLKKGTMGSYPKPPDLIDDASVKEIPIAQIRVNKNSSTVIIVDERIPVHSLIEIPIGEMWNIFDTWFQSVKNTLGQRVMSGATELPEMFAGDIWLREVE